MRKVIAITAAAATLTVTATTAFAATQTVRVGDNWFVRKTNGTPALTVRAGDTLRFRWVGKQQHNVAVQSGPQKFKSPTKRSGTYSRRVTRRGTYLLICEIHGRGDQSMRLRVR